MFVDSMAVEVGVTLDGMNSEGEESDGRTEDDCVSTLDVGVMRTVEVETEVNRIISDVSGAARGGG